MSKMKMLPVQLSLNSLNPGIWSDVLWRCPPAPSSQLAELKTQLPPSLPSDPRLWSREDVLVFLRFCVREFDLPKLDFDLFQMNGKALCLLTRADFGHRCPGAGDVLHNVLQMLIIESHMMQWHLPNSPVTPTSRYPLSPHSHPPTPTWPPLNAPPENSPFHSSAHSLAGHHFMAPNSVTLSPPPSVDSQASSPPQAPYQNGGATGAAPGSAGGSAPAAGGATNTSNPTSSSASSTGSNGSQPNIMPMKGISSASSNHSDSEEEYSETSGGVSKMPPAPLSYSTASPPGTPILKDIKPNWTQQLTNSFVNSWSQQQQQQQQQQAAAVAAVAAQAQQHQLQQQQQQQQLPQKLTLDNTAGPVVTPAGGSISAPTTPSYMYKAKREFFPENSEPNTNGRLLWDFLQQLLNDRNQKYSDLIAWKCRDTGVFKIVDPAGLAKLWGIQKNHLSMNYDKMSRALRYYYRVNILRKVQGERHCYQFLRNPTELKNIKNISLLRQSTPANGNGGSPSMPQGSSQAPGSPAGQNWNPQQQSQQQQQSPQRPASRNGPMSLPAVAAVAAAAAAAYGPPPTSPLFMHAINGAFHYLSAAAAGPPPNSPALNTPSAVGGPDKFQFHPLKLENGSGSGSESAGEDLKPTDLSVSSKSTATSNEDCYPLIRNADGLTTIKLIRYNEHQVAASPAGQSPKHDDQQAGASNASSSPRPMDQASEQAQPVPMESDCNGGESEDSFRHMQQ
uniref:Ets DNA-binding protein pokkuri n=2 Tax=Drosophila melanogaster TaxID=7227 RepID=POK_DROME|eukprot:NP_001259908.1 anterior open, isoform C [Drosophila melanogaster]